MRALLPLLLLALPAAASAQDTPPLLSPEAARAIASEVSGGAAKRIVQALSLHHRMRGSEGYRAAAELIRDRLKAYGLAEADIISLPADGTIFYGTQRSRPAWNASFAELWEERREDGRWRDAERIASWADQPITLAQDSVAGAAEAELVDVGAGTSARDYEGRDVRGKLVLTSSQPGAVARLAVTERGAAGIISWAQNQKTGWWGDDRDLIRWGHLDTWDDPSFAFMVSPARADAWRARLAKGETVRLRAKVEAGRSPGAYLIPTAVIAGADRTHEIVLSCHLDHPSPGANDNASGCAGILEVARSLDRLVKEGRLPRPRRTIRFIWPCEVECTIALLNGRPEVPKRTLATIHLDMIGGNTDITHGTLKVEGSPPSLPSFVSDVGFAIGRFVDDQSRFYAERGAAAMPLLDPEGTKNALHARIGGFSEGSDHQVWAEGSWRVPVVYIADWPDIYIHTDKDVPANLDATKMKRAIFIAAASAWFLANASQADAEALTIAAGAEARMRDGEAHVGRVLTPEERNLRNRLGWRHDEEVVRSLSRFGIGPWQPLPELARAEAELARIVPPRKPAPRPSPLYRRNPDLKGPMDGFGYSWLDDHLKQAGLPKPALLARETGEDGPSFGYETLNLVDGRRSVQEIRDALAATVAPVPLEEVAAYLATLERLGVIRR
ncbi:MAG: M28 family peptidase [Alphaproteobacteria bacterium]|nr:M28 family peptidase [Alphaproteobacteria bacterium]MBV9370636.1 M28 family peptidase [Alphaproteobacteria bacterium]MBV9900000.1 M28 family peptidase [Alphaproteobacteria bacterium]